VQYRSTKGLAVAYQLVVVAVGAPLSSFGVVVGVVVVDGAGDEHAMRRPVQDATIVASAEESFMPRE
jgi:hypothetical protein